jgi:hypothetical protein
VLETTGYACENGGLEPDNFRWSVDNRREEVCDCFPTPCFDLLVILAPEQ